MPALGHQVCQMVRGNTGSAMAAVRTQETRSPRQKASTWGKGSGCPASRRIRFSVSAEVDPSFAADTATTCRQGSGWPPSVDSLHLACTSRMVPGRRGRRHCPVAAGQQHWHLALSSTCMLAWLLCLTSRKLVAHRARDAVALRDGLEHVLLPLAQRPVERDVALPPHVLVAVARRHRLACSFTHGPSSCLMSGH